MLQELKDFLRELRYGHGQTSLPDLFVVARDANCLGYAERLKEITAATTDYQGFMVPAIPDPHVERWLLIDTHAFKQVFNLGCQAPDQKCDRNRYKLLLEEAVRAAGVEPLLGGVEFGEDIVLAMNLDRASRADNSFAHLLRDLRAAFQKWASK